MVITADGGYRRGAIVPLKKNVDDALKSNEQIERVIVFRRANNEIHIKEGRDAWWHREMEYVDGNCPPEPMDSEDALYILYTSGSTGKPKGILHTTAGYLLGTALTTKYVFDLRAGGHLLVHRRYWLGHRPQLHCVWPAMQRRDGLDV